MMIKINTDDNIHDDDDNSNDCRADGDENIDILAMYCNVRVAAPCTCVTTAYPTLAGKITSTLWYFL